MRAMVLEHGGRAETCPLLLQDVRLPEPGPDEVRVKVNVCGGYAEYATVPEHFAYPIPAIFTDEEAAPLLCAGIIGYRALRLSGVQPGQRLGLYGFGASAHITIQVARHWGCSIFVCSLQEEHRALARELGAVWVGGAAEPPPEKLHGA